MLDFITTTGFGYIKKMISFYRKGKYDQVRDKNRYNLAARGSPGLIDLCFDAPIIAVSYIEAILTGRVLTS